MVEINLILCIILMKDRLEFVGEIMNELTYKRIVSQEDKDIFLINEIHSNPNNQERN